MSEGPHGAEGERSGDLSPQFKSQQEAAKTQADPDNSISLTQYYLKGSVQERKTAPEEREEFFHTLN